jgi:predicted O-methyltransferase YrrM
VAEEENLRFTRRVLESLRPDPVWIPRILQRIDRGCIELRSLLAWLARELNPASYLEVGVRRGFSMAMVAARCPDVALYGFDLWIRNYAGVDNPGPGFVRQEIRRLGHRGPIHLISGDSHVTLPRFLRQRRAFWSLRLSGRHRPHRFSLITIDGDHSILGAYQDLSETMPFCAAGGAVVFDDITPDPATAGPEAVLAERGADPYGWGDLLGVWRAVRERFPDFRFFEFLDASPGVGLAIRLR